MKNYIRKNFLQNNEAVRHEWVRAILGRLPEGARILDAGAGEGRYRMYCDHLQYVSQDFGEYDGSGDGSALQTGEWNIEEVHLICDICKIPEPDESFDAILCTEVFEHLPSPIKAIEEFSRLLKPGGKLILTAPFASMTHFAPYHFYSGFNKYFYTEHMPSFGFHIVQLEENGNYFALIAQELIRLPSVMQKENASAVAVFISGALALLLAFFIKPFMSKKGDASDIACFGYHLLATKDQI